MIYWLAMSNSMYNPMIYCYMNQRSVIQKPIVPLKIVLLRFRKGFNKVFDKMFCQKEQA